MTARIDPRGGKFPSLSQEETEEQFAECLLEEEEDAPCSQYVVMSQERHMPALQEYLNELHAHGALIFR